MLRRGAEGSQSLKRPYAPPLPLHLRHDPQPDLWADEGGIAACAEAVAVEGAGEEDCEVGEVLGVGLGLAVEAAGEGDGVGHAAHGQEAGDPGLLQGAGDRCRAEGNAGMAGGVEQVWSFHRLCGEEEARASAGGVEGDVDPARAEIAQINPHIRRCDRHCATIVADGGVIGEAHGGGGRVEAVALGRGGGLRGDEAEGEGEASDHKVRYARRGAVDVTFA